MQLELPERRAVVHAGRGPAGQRLACDRRRHVLPGAREIAGAPIAGARLEHHRPGGLDPVGEGRAPRRQHDLAGILPGDRAEAHRRVRRAPGGRADLARPGGKGPSGERLGQDADRVDVAELALIGAHPRRGVALHVLHRAEALLRGEPDVRGRHVVLEIDERLGSGTGRGDLPAWLDVQGRLLRASGNARGRRGEAERRARLGPGPPPLLQRGPQIECAVARPGAALRLDAVPGHEAGGGLVVHRTPAGLRVQVDARAPSPRAEHQIAGHAAPPAGVARRCDERRLDGAGPGDADDRAAAQHLDPARGQCGDQRPGRLGRTGANVGEHRHLDPRLHEVEDRAVRRAVVGDRDRPRSRTHPVTAHAGERRGGEHHPGAIVVGEHQGPLRRAGRQHHPPRPHLPQAFVDPWLRGRQLHHGEQIVVVVARHGGPVEPHHVGQGVELLRHVRRPLQGRTPADRRSTVEKHSAGYRPVVGDRHPGAAARRGQRRLKPGRTRARDQHVAVVEALLVRAPVRPAGSGAESGHAAHEPPVEVPAAGRSHERLVVEPGREQPREPVGDRARVEADARPAVDAARAQTLPEREGRRPGVGLVVFAVELHDGVGLLGPGRDDPARAVVLEAAADQAHPVGRQGGGEGVAGMALVLPAVEPEAEPAGTVDERPARGEPKGLGAGHPRTGSIRPDSSAKASRFIALVFGQGPVDSRLRGNGGETACHVIPAKAGMTPSPRSWPAPPNRARPSSCGIGARST